MAVEHSADLLPILDERGFDTAMRGYDKRQVDHYLIKIEDELREASTERDIAAARNSELSNQLTSHQAQIDSLRRQLRAATDPVTEDNVDVTVRALMQDAKRKARQVHADADIYADDSRIAADEAAARVLLTARAEADQLVADATRRVKDADEMFRRRIAEAERVHDEAVAEGERSLARTRADEDHLTQEAAAARAALDAEAVAERARLTEESQRVIAENEAASAERIRVAEEDFEIILRQRRTKEIAESEALLAGAKADSESMVTTASAEAAETLLSAKTESELLRTTAKSESETLLATATRDSEAMLSAARTESETTLSSAKADSEQMRDAATAEANQTRAEALMTAESTLTAAKAEAESLVSAAELKSSEILSDAERKATNLLGIARGQVRTLDNQRMDLHRELNSLSERLHALVAKTPEPTPVD